MKNGKNSHIWMFNEQHTHTHTNSLTHTHSLTHTQCRNKKKTLTEMDFKLKYLEDNKKNTNNYNNIFY